MIINTIVLNKFGWSSNNYWNRPFKFIDVNKEDIKYDYLNKFFILQNPNTKAHFFVIVENKNIVNREVEMSKCYLKLIKTNSELFKIIIENDAFNEEYKRHFKINKILKNK